MSFPVNPKDGLIYNHRNGLTYVYSKGTSCWDIVHDNMTPVAGAPRRKPSPTLKVPSPTLEINAETLEVDNELS
jgi:hypothetical protein